MTASNSWSDKCWPNLIRILRSSDRVVEPSPSASNDLNASRSSFFFAGIFFIIDMNLPFFQL